MYVIELLTQIKREKIHSTTEHKKDIHPSKKVTQHDFDRLYLFYPGFEFIKLDIPRKPVHLPFD